MEKASKAGGEEGKSPASCTHLKGGTGKKPLPVAVERIRMRQGGKHSRTNRRLGALPAAPKKEIRARARSPLHGRLSLCQPQAPAKRRSLSEKCRSRGRSAEKGWRGGRQRKAGNKGL